jgi:hypothetical protein
MTFKNYFSRSCPIPAMTYGRAYGGVIKTVGKTLPSAFKTKIPGLNTWDCFYFLSVRRELSLFFSFDVNL